MPGVRSALRHNIDDGAAVAAIFGFPVGKDTQLGHGIDWQDGRWISKHARLVDSRIVAIPIIHVGAIEQEVVGAAARTVHRERTK